MITATKKERRVIKAKLAFAKASFAKASKNAKKVTSKVEKAYHKIISSRISKIRARIAAAKSPEKRAALKA